MNPILEPAATEWAKAEELARYAAKVRGQKRRCQPFKDVF